jgi:hypothetical protein
VGTREATRAPRISWRRRVRALLGGSLDASLRAAFARECETTNHRRALVLLPILLAVHVVHMGIFHTSPAERAALPPRVLVWRDGIALTHLVTFAVACALYLFGRSRHRRAPALLGPATGLLYLLHGAVIAGVDQLAITSVTPYVGYCLGVAVVIAAPPLATIALYLIALAAFLVAMTIFQPSPTVRLAMLPNGVSITAVSIAVAWMLDAARRRDFAQRAIIDEQRATLAHMNLNLEQRLKEQVAEVVARAEEVERLNAQLQAQVRERSTELSLALARLARRRDEEGALRAGVVLADRFEIEAAIGEGGMGTVYRALDRSTREQVAIKVIQAASARELDALRRFLQEAASTATVNHPAVVRVLHVDVSGDGMLFQVQELVDGDTLHRRLTDRPWDPGVAARVTSVVCVALAAALGGGVFHRDVKPGNV